MIWFDVTKTSAAGHKSGLTRVTQRLVKELGAAAEPQVWRGAAAVERMVPQGPGPAAPSWWITAEVFTPDEREGFADFLRARPVRMGAIFHDAIPLELPHVTWPQAVARHPAYMSMLAEFDAVWAVSQHSREKLEGFWRWQGRKPRAAVGVLQLGADFAGGLDARGRRAPDPQPEKALLCVGIIEPRKGQDFLLGVAERLWSAGADFELWIVGRVNPHFGRATAKRLRAHPRVRLFGAVDDATLARLYRRAAACVFPTRAEGCGLPLLEALACGTPCVASDLPALRENAAGGGCRLVPRDDAGAWTAALGALLADPAPLASEAAARSGALPRWADSARQLQSFLSA